jgi:hypothetical protein
MGRYSQIPDGPSLPHPECLQRPDPQPPAQCGRPGQPIGSKDGPCRPEWVHAITVDVRTNPLTMTAVRPLCIFSLFLPYRFQTLKLILKRPPGLKLWIKIQSFQSQNKVNTLLVS